MIYITVLISYVLTSLLEFKENDEGEGKYYETCKEKKEIGRDAEKGMRLTIEGIDFCLNLCFKNQE